MKKITAFLKHEFLKMLPPTIYFFVVLHIILFARNLLAQEWGVSSTSSAFATIGALIIGKSILIVDALPLFKRLGRKRLIYDLAARTVLYLVIALLLQFLEELIPLIVRHGDLSGATEHIKSEIEWSKFWVSHILMGLFLVFYTLITGVSQVIGYDIVLGTLLNPAPEKPASHKENR
ncbi:MAG: hypothetical protein V2J20_00305 [Wenzhouxiangella sp.]|jgi:hypothetical protein|nr:hypothetical protein [Wenzhouxiangella sp.]